MQIDLLADIGGTNARVAFRENGAPWGKVHTRETADFASLDALLADVITQAEAKPTRAAIALAGPVQCDAVQLTNLPWRVERSALARELGVSALALANDLEAVAWALPHLTAADVVSWRDLPYRAGARVVVASGTGLGVGALVPNARGWAAVPSEAGHALAVMPRETPEPLRKLWRLKPSWENLISGAGLLRIYKALGGTAATPAAVTAHAAASDPLALEAVGFFSELLGACAGDMAMIFAAKGGCYIGGGVVPALGPLFDVARFIAGFSDKGAYAPYVDAIAINLIAHPYPALVGLSAVLDAGGSAL